LPSREWSDCFDFFIFISIHFLVTVTSIIV
jgi:hypothetical protein